MGGGGCQEQTALQGSHVLCQINPSLGRPRSAPKQTRGATWARASHGKNKRDPPSSPYHPQSCHSPQIPTRDPAWPQLTVVPVHGRHGPGVSRFRAKQPETGAGADTGASLKANQRLGRLRTSARKAPDVPRRAVPRPRSSRGRAFGDPWLTPEGKNARAGPRPRRAGKRNGRALERSLQETRCAGAPILMGKDMGTLEHGLSGSER